MGASMAAGNVALLLGLDYSMPFVTPEGNINGETIIFLFRLYQAFKKNYLGRSHREQHFYVHRRTPNRLL